MVQPHLRALRDLEELLGGGHEEALGAEIDQATADGAQHREEEHSRGQHGTQQAPPEDVSAKLSKVFLSQKRFPFESS